MKLQRRLQARSLRKLQRKNNVSPIVFIIFGATGDLVYRKIMPALYALGVKHAFDVPIFFIGVGRRDITSDQFAELMARSVHDAVGNDFDGEMWTKLFSGFEYVKGDFSDPATYTSLTRTLEQFDSVNAACVPRFFYLATPPVHYEPILKHLKESSLSEGCGQGTSIYTKVILEKPFGSDLSTSRMLDQLLGSIFEEKQIFRIDHYLGKETIQNVLALRFANGMFEPTWNGEFLDHVQITLAEDQGVGVRGTSYDEVGALRDVVQNHMLEMLSLIAMDQPLGFDAQSLRDAKAKVLQKLLPASSVVTRAQYAGYQKEPGVAEDSKTETFVALKVMLDSDRWRDVPFYLRTGKKLTKKVTEISLHYKKPVCATDSSGAQVCFFNPDTVMRNVLVIQIAPHEGICLRLMVKEPGYGMKLADETMSFSYEQAFKHTNGTSEYEKLLLDAIHGDQTLFARTDGIEASWQMVTPILDAWKDTTAPMYVYKQGTWGPKEADALIEQDGRHWFLGEK